MTGNAVVPVIETMSPTPSRMSRPASAICPPVGVLRFGWIATRSAPAPRMSRFTFAIVSAFVPMPPVPSTYVPGQTTITSPLLAASIAAWMLVNAAPGHCVWSSSTVRVAAEAAEALSSAVTATTNVDIDIRPSNTATSQRNVIRHRPAAGLSST